MSWLSGYTKKPTPTVSDAEIREAKRKKLEEDRKLRAQKRADTQKQLQSALQAQREADQAYRDFLDIAEDIFEDDTAAAEDIQNISDFLNDSESEIMNFDAENGTDGDKAIEKLNTVVCPFDKTDVE